MDAGFSAADEAIELVDALRALRRTVHAGESSGPEGVWDAVNVLGVYPSILDHPIEKLRAAGVRVSVNTDDPALLGASLIGEYALCRRTFGWTDAMTKSVAQTSIDASFANVDVKAQLLAALKDW